MIVVEGLREEVRTIVGGGQIDEEIRQYTGAGAFGVDVMEAISLAKGWIRGN